MWVTVTFAYMIAALVITTRLVAGQIQGQMQDGFVRTGFGPKLPIGFEGSEAALVNCARREHPSFQNISTGSPNRKDPLSRQ